MTKYTAVATVYDRDHNIDLGVWHGVSYTSAFMARVDLRVQLRNELKDDDLYGVEITYTEERHEPENMIIYHVVCDHGMAMVSGQTKEHALERMPHLGMVLQVYAIGHTADHVLMVLKS